METLVKASDSRIWEVIPRQPTLSQIATGFGFTEGPVWCGEYLLFSDIPRNRIVKLSTLSHGPEVTTFRYPSGNSNGLTMDVSGRLIACHHSLRCITRTEIDGSVSVLADRYKGKRLNSPNDVVVKSDGSIYFTDPPYGLKNFVIWKEIEFNGVYRFSPDGELTLLVDDFERPNGLAFSPDESVLYINDTAKKHIRAFDTDADGNLSNERIIDMQGAEPGAPDGMKVDSQGNIFCTGPGGLWVIDPSGKPLGCIAIPELPANLAWGDPDLKTLYITARSSIYSLQLEIPGIVVWVT